MLKRSVAVAIAVATALPAPAYAAGQAAAPNTTTGDPNEKICQNIVPVGSRLAKKRICATRAEWNERNRLDRQAVDQAQRVIGGPCSTSANKNIGPPAC